MADRLRVLVAGFLNSPHVTAWADAVAAAGHDVHLAGRNAPSLPPAGSAPDVHVLRSDGPPLRRSLRLGRALARLARELRPDVIHAHWLPEYGWLAAREGLHPLVCSAWGSDVLSVRGIGRARSLRALRGASLVVADSEHLAREVRALAPREVRVEVARPGLDLERFSPGDPLAARTALGLAERGPLVAGVRGLDAVYNPQLLLEAFARIAATRPDARLLLKHSAARVPSAVAATIERLGLENAVVPLGAMSQERVAAVYRAADVVVSIPSSDSSPRSVWEALACGRPVVVSDLPWARDELASGDHALLTPLEAKAVAAAIARVLEDDSLARRLATAGRALARDKLNPEKCARRIDDLYRLVVGGTR